MIVDFRIVPIGTGSPHLSGAIAEVLKIVDASKVKYQVNDMRTVLEGDWDTVIGLIKKCHAKAMEKSERVSTMIAIDDRKGVEFHIGDKVKSLEKALGKPLKK